MDQLFSAGNSCSPAANMSYTLRILAIGAHPDDVEIGAGALISKTLRAGHDVYLLVLTDHPVNAKTRRREALKAAEALGLTAERVLFAGFTDGYLRINAATVRRVRDMVSGIRPDVVVVHTAADSHNDHVEAHRIAHAAFRTTMFLHYSVHVSCELSRFNPQIFVEVSGERDDVKRRALSAHVSQQLTIERSDLARYETALGSLARMGRAEAFEIEFQAGAAHNLRRVMMLSESPFHFLWLPIVTDSHITLLYPSAAKTALESSAVSELHLNTGLDNLRHSFRSWWGGASRPLREVFANSARARTAILHESCVLVGGPRANMIVRDVYNGNPEVRWVIECDPGMADTAYIYDRHRDERLYLRMDRGLQSDFGVVSRVEHPYASKRSIVYVSGTTALGTRAGLDILAEPGRFLEIARLLSQNTSIELLFSVDQSLGNLRIVDYRCWGRGDHERQGLPNGTDLLVSHPRP